jgi:hypothetical protein
MTGAKKGGRGRKGKHQVWTRQIARAPLAKRWSKSAKTVAVFDHGGQTISSLATKLPKYRNIILQAPESGFKRPVVR